MSLSLCDILDEKSKIYVKGESLLVHIDVKVRFQDLMGIVEKIGEEE